MRKSIKALGASSIPFILWFIQGTLPLFVSNQSDGFFAVRAIMCLPMLIMLLIDKTKLSYKLIEIALVSAPLVVAFAMGEKAEIISYIAISIVSVAIIIYVIASARKDRETLDGNSENGAVALIVTLVFIPLLSLINSIYYVGRYTYLDGWFPLHNAVFIISVILGAALVVLMLKISAIKKNFWGSVGCFLLGVILSIALLAITLCNLNYALDRSTPEIKTVTIEDKDIDRNRKSSDDYEFIFSVGGEKYSAEVPSEIYYDYEIGDTFDIKIYRGAFDHPFFMAEFWE